ncbi:head decoration protein [Chitiniphilus eburneus]|uniref:head decoration protein n=1 Tax=Chitiniphilus eburneus TaxID=2571148 RepID=UPI0035D0D56F
MIKTEGIHAGEFLLSEGAGQISRDDIVLAAGVFLPAGQVLGLVTATKRYAPYDNGASDGSEVAAAILHAPLPESANPRRAAAITRLAEVSGALLTGLDAPARADLAARFLIVR